MQHKLRAQRGACALVQRAIILHGGKLVALAAFGAAMQAPGALGWVLTCALQVQLSIPVRPAKSNQALFFSIVWSGSGRHHLCSAPGWACCDGARQASAARLRAGCE